MAWKRFHVPKFDHRPLKGLTYSAPPIIGRDEEARIAEAAAAGDASIAGAYGVEPDAALLERLAFQGDCKQMMMCALPTAGGHLLARSYAWFNQRAFVLDGNAPDASVLHEWHTPRPNNTRFGPEDGAPIERRVIYLLNGRILDDHTRGNRIMVDANWTPDDGAGGYRIIAACDPGEDNFHDSCFEVTWAA